MADDGDLKARLKAFEEQLQAIQFLYPGGDAAAAASVRRVLSLLTTPTCLVVPLTLGLRTYRGDIGSAGRVMTEFIPRDSVPPCKKTLVFTTCKDDQTNVEIAIFEGERTLTRYCLFISQFKLGGIPPAPRGSPKIEVTFEVFRCGALCVSAEHKDSGMYKYQILTTSNFRHEPDCVQNIVRVSNYCAEEDKKREKIIDPLGSRFSGVPLCLEEEGFCQFTSLMEELELDPTSAEFHALLENLGINSTSSETEEEKPAEKGMEEKAEDYDIGEFSFIYDLELKPSSEEEEVMDGGQMKVETEEEEFWIPDYIDEGEFSSEEKIESPEPSYQFSWFSWDDLYDVEFKLKESSEEEESAEKETEEKGDEDYEPKRCSDLELKTSSDAEEVMDGGAEEEKQTAEEEKAEEEMDGGAEEEKRTAEEAKAED